MKEERHSYKAEGENNKKKSESEDLGHREKNAAFARAFSVWWKGSVSYVKWRCLHYFNDPYFH